MKLTVDRDRLAQELDRLATFSEVPPPAVTRIVYSAEDQKARAYVKGLCSAAGLAIREDAAGNTFARWIGSDPQLPAVGTGSHIDAIPNAGRYDGTVGVLGGLEAIRTLQSAGFAPTRSIELLLFISEEPTRFGIGCLGSRLMAGALQPASGESLKDSQGRTLNQVRAEAGFTGSLDSVCVAPGSYSAFLELHIEQGPLLERSNIPIGIVTGIAAPASLRLKIQGEGGHAGAVLMHDRRDAFLAAAEIALAVERVARSTGSIDTVATTGVCRVFPGAINSIPSQVQLELDIRDIDAERRNQVVEAVAAAVRDTSAARRVEISSETINADPPAACDPGIIRTLVQCCEAHDLDHQLMISRAYHDSLFVSRFAPTAMLFIPCRNGVSHHPSEFASIDAIGTGVLILADALARLSS